MADLFDKIVQVALVVLTIVFFGLGLVTWRTIGASEEKGSGFFIPIALIVAAAVSLGAFLIVYLTKRPCRPSASVAASQSLPSAAPTAYSLAPPAAAPTQQSPQFERM